MGLFDDIFDWIWIVPCVLIGLFALPYVLGPILIRCTLKLSGDPELDEFYLDSRKIPRAVRDYVEDTVDEVERDGFAVLGAYFLASLVPNVKSFVVLVGKEKTGDVALLAVTYADSGTGGELKQRHIEYVTVYGGDDFVATNNSEELNAFAPVKGKVSHSLPWIKDVRHLYQVHRGVLGRDRPDGEPKWLVGDDPAVYLRKGLIREMSRQLPTGYLYRDGNGDFRPTVKGAVLMTYKNLWPISSLLKARRKSNGMALLRELGLEQPKRRPRRREEDDE